MCEMWVCKNTSLCNLHTALLEVYENVQHLCNRENSIIFNITEFLKSINETVPLLHNNEENTILYTLLSFPAIELQNHVTGIPGRVVESNPAL